MIDLTDENAKLDFNLFPLMGRWEGMEQDFFPIANTIDAFWRFFLRHVKNFWASWSKQ